MFWFFSVIAQSAIFGYLISIAIKSNEPFVWGCASFVGMLAIAIAANRS